MVPCCKVPSILVPCSRVPRQCSEGILAPSPSTTTCFVRTGFQTANPQYLERYPFEINLALSIFAVNISQLFMMVQQHIKIFLIKYTFATRN